MSQEQTPHGGPALVFPGQGAQAEGMGRPWRGGAGWHVVERMSDVLALDVGALLLDATGEELRRTSAAQVALLALELVIWEELRAAGVTPSVVAGHSVGEIAALVAGGALTPEAAALLVRRRALAMEAACVAEPGSMAVLTASAEEAERLCEQVGDVWVAADNADDVVTVAGRVAAIQAVTAAARERTPRLRVLPLKVGGAFHSPLMAPALPEVRLAVAEARLSAPCIPVVANVDADAHDSPEQWTRLLVEQVVRPVRWRQSMERLSSLGAARLVEAGPGPTLAPLARKSGHFAEVTTVRAPGDIDGVLAPSRAG